LDEFRIPLNEMGGGWNAVCNGSWQIAKRSYARRRRLAKE
jgi:hypothetical protein